MGDGVRRFQSRDDPFRFRQHGKGVKGGPIVDGDVFHPAGMFPIGVLGPDAGIVQPGGDGVDRHGLPVVVLENVRKHTVQDARSAAAQRGCVPADAQTITTDLNMVSVYMTRSDYSKALERVNHALAIDPNNAEAKQTRARVEMAASNDGLGWGYGGRVRARPVRRR